MRKTLALDANVLVLLTVGLCDVKFIARHKRLHPVYREKHFDLLLDVIAHAPALATTTHALTEASNLSRQCGDPMRSEITRTLGLLIKRAEELTLPAVRAAADPHFPRLGLTDWIFTLLDPRRFRVLSRRPRTNLGPTGEGVRGDEFPTTCVWRVSADQFGPASALVPRRLIENARDIGREGTQHLEVEAVLHGRAKARFGLHQQRSRRHADRERAQVEVERAAGGEQPRRPRALQPKPDLPMRDVDEAVETAPSACSNRPSGRSRFPRRSAAIRPARATRRPARRHSPNSAARRRLDAERLGHGADDVGPAAQIEPRRERQR